MRVLKTCRHYCETSILGDHDAAMRELLDCAAVIMLEWERIEQ